VCVWLCFGEPRKPQPRLGFAFFCEHPPSLGFRWPYKLLRALRQFSPRGAPLNVGPLNFRTQGHSLLAQDLHLPSSSFLLPPSTFHLPPSTFYFPHRPAKERENTARSICTQPLLAASNSVLISSPPLPSGRSKYLRHAVR
jgi:hypothetical protein